MANGGVALSKLHGTIRYYTVTAGETQKVTSVRHQVRDERKSEVDRPAPNRPSNRSTGGRHA